MNHATMAIVHDIRSRKDEIPDWEKRLYHIIADQLESEHRQNISREERPDGWTADDWVRYNQDLKGIIDELRRV